jgi:isoamylase
MNDGNNPCFGVLMDGRAQESGIKRRGSDVTLLTIYNAHYDVVEFKLPAVADGKSWTLLVDTNQPQLAPFSFALGQSYAVTGRSLLFFELATEPDGHS